MKNMRSRLIVAFLFVSLLGVLGFTARKWFTVTPQLQGTGVERGTVAAPRGAAARKTELNRGVQDEVVLRLLNFPEARGAASGDFDFEVINNSRSPLMCPDGWYLEFDDGSITNLSLGQTGNIRVNPGRRAMIAIHGPARTNSWRLGASYYFEDSLFQVKVRISQSAFKDRLPATMSSIQGKNVLSDWVR
jgi:hypothetical protein